MKKYITTAIPYVNGAPHIGHALDYCLADVCARYWRMCGDEVKFQAGTDEHGSKIYQKATELEIPVSEYVLENSNRFKEFIGKLDVEYTDFIRTTAPEHERRCQEIWRKLADHIYKANYEGWYCTGCERYITDKEVSENGRVCPDHNKPYERLSEENYYFRISDFKSEIIQAIESDKMLILPEFRKNEVLKLIEDSPDVSISRPVSQLTWGVPVPDDTEQVMYVWMDALANYITVLGYPDKDISEFWPASAQFVGKDILRFHAIIWPAMLLGLGLELPRVLVSHGMVLSNGQKMSKSIGNVVNPVDVLEKHGVDAFRYFFLRHIDTFADSDYTDEKFESAYNNELANDLGNLVQRLATLISKNGVEIIINKVEFDKEYVDYMDKFEFSRALDYVWERIQGINKKIDEEKPWALAKNNETKELGRVLNELTNELVVVNEMLAPFLPGTSEKIHAVFCDGKVVPPEKPLFPRG